MDRESLILLAHMQRAVRQEKRRREAADRDREAADRDRHAEKRRRIAAERKLDKTCFLDLLQECHDLYIKVRVETDPDRATRGEPSYPDNRLYPQKIIPWDDFMHCQAEIWGLIDTNPAFSTDLVFEPLDRLRARDKRLKCISSEQILRHVEEATVEDMILEMLLQVKEDESLREVFKLGGSASFQDHTQLGERGNTKLAKRARRVRDARKAARKGRQGSSNPKTGTADQFLVLEPREGSTPEPVCFIEYKAPHKVTKSTIRTGLGGVIHTNADVINPVAKLNEPESQGDQDHTQWCKYTMAAVITQAFSSMIDKGARYGYICTGQAYVFLHIGDDPTEVYYSIQIPGDDVKVKELEDHSGLKRSALAQVFAFVLQAAKDSEPDQKWFERTGDLSLWEVDVDELIRRMAETQKDDELPSSESINPGGQEFQPSSQMQPSSDDYNRDVPRREVTELINSAPDSPHQTSSGCKPDDITRHKDSDSDDSARGSGSRDKQVSAWSSRLRTRARHQQSSKGGQWSRSAARESKDAADHEKTQRLNIRERPFCTHACLRGLALSKNPDPHCPNSKLHGINHLAMADFLSLVNQQLLVDRGKDADCMKMPLAGARGGLLKICLTSHGYTFVAKGVQSHDRKFLNHEHEIYKRLLPLQGRWVPVCLGLVELSRVYYYLGISTQLSHLLLMSWGGYSMVTEINKKYWPEIPKRAAKALAELHRLHILHMDAEPRNMVFDGTKLMLIDFERSMVLSRMDDSAVHRAQREMASMRRSLRKV